LKKLTGLYLKKALKHILAGYIPTGIASGPDNYVIPAIIIETKTRECYYHRNCETGGVYWTHCEISYDYEYNVSDITEGWLDYPGSMPQIRQEWEKLEKRFNLYPDGKRQWKNCLGNSSKTYLFPGETKIIDPGGAEPGI